METKMSLQDKIKTVSLTKTDRKIADYILDHQDTIGLETVTQLALNIGVSDTSIIRLLRTLGYAGYADFKRKMASQMVRQYRETRENMTPGEKYLRTSDVLTKDDVVSEVMNKALENIKNTFASTDPQLLQAVADCIMRCRRKYIIGFRGASSCSNYMARKMVLLLPNVIGCDRAESAAIEQIVDITPNDCILLYTFPRYSKINFVIMEMAKSKGAKVILITDRITTPLAAKADFVLRASVEGAGITVSYVVPMCLSEAILLLISKNMKKVDKKRLEFLDKFISEHELY